MIWLDDFAKSNAMSHNTEKPHLRNRNLTHAGTNRHTIRLHFLCLLTANTLKYELLRLYSWQSRFDSIMKCQFYCAASYVIIFAIIHNSFHNLSYIKVALWLWDRWQWLSSIQQVTISKVRPGQDGWPKYFKHRKKWAWHLIFAEMGVPWGTRFLGVVKHPLSLILPINNSGKR